MSFPTNSTVASTFGITRSNQPQLRQELLPDNFVVLHQPQIMPVMRSRAQRRAEEKQAQKNTRLGGPQLHRTRLNRQEIVSRIRQQSREIVSNQISRTGQLPALMEEFEAVYHFDTLAADGKALFNQITSVMQSLWSCFPDLRIGPPVAEAGVVKSTAINKKASSVGAFVSIFENDFDIRISDDLENSQNLQGVTIVIGEIHGNRIMQQQFKRILNNLQAENGDLLMVEGDAQVCEQDAAIYQIPIKSCVALEEGFAPYEQTKMLGLQHKNDLLRLVEFIQSKIKTSSAEVVKGDVFSYLKFIQQYKSSVPEKFMPECQRLWMAADQSGLKFKHAANNQNLLREKKFIHGIRAHHTEQSTNFMIIGAMHVANMASDLLGDKPGKIILMVPYELYATKYGARLPLKKHDEL